MSLCSLHVPSCFGRSAAGSEVSTVWIFPQGVLAANTLVGGRAEVGVATVRAGASLLKGCHRPVRGGAGLKGLEQES